LFDDGRTVLLGGVQKFGLWIRVIYSVCLVVATVNHIQAVHAWGWVPSHLPIASALYWSSLTFFDPLAAALLFVRPRAGILLTIAIIVSDVAHNLWFTAKHPMGASFLRDVTSSFALMSQIAFLLFVAATASIAWRESQSSSRAG
jgi:hypothetical protein